MKRKFTIAFLSFIVLLGSSRTVKAQCKNLTPMQMKELLKADEFDNFRKTIIENSKDPYDIQFEVKLLKKVTYKLAFDMSGKSEGVIVKVFDLGKKKSNAEPELMYASTEDEMDENAIFNVEFDDPRTRILVKYEVKNATYEGCVTFMLGTTGKK